MHTSRLIIMFQSIISDPPKSIADFAYDRETVEILFDVISNMTFEGVSVSGV